MKTNTSNKLLPLLGSQFEVDRPPFLPLKGLTAPRFCRSPPPLRAAVWQWVVIQYLSAPPPPPGGRGWGHIWQNGQLMPQRLLNKSTKLSFCMYVRGALHKIVWCEHGLTQAG